MPPDVAHHALRVLRLKSGDAVTVFNGAGGEFQGVLETGPAGSALVHLLRFDPREAEMTFSVCVAQGLCAAEKMDWVLEKSVELGAQSVQPLAMQRSVARLAPERAAKRHQHWQQVVRAASEQCGRNRIAAVGPLQDLADWLSQGPAGASRLMLDPEARVPLATLPRPAPGETAVLLIGPEGGMTPAEKASAVAHGYDAVSLGPRILRTETAAAAALATLAAVWGTGAG